MRKRKRYCGGFGNKFSEQKTVLFFRGGGPLPGGGGPPLASESVAVPEQEYTEAGDVADNEMSDSEAFENTWNKRQRKRARAAQHQRGTLNNEKSWEAASQQIFKALVTIHAPFAPCAHCGLPAICRCFECGGNQLPEYTCLGCSIRHHSRGVSQLHKWEKFRPEQMCYARHELGKHASQGLFPAPLTPVCVCVFVCVCVCVCVCACLALSWLPEGSH
jgi:hypothetical protein